MRKCYLCGSVIRRRAEYCRFCSARQPDAQGERAHDRVAFVPPQAGPRPWMVSAPPTYATTSAEPAGATTFEPRWDAATETRSAEPVDLDMSAMTPVPTDVEPDPWIFDEPTSSTTTRPEHPDHYPSTVTPRRLHPGAEAERDPEPVAAEPEPAPEPAPEPVAAERPVEDVEAPTNGHDDPSPVKAKNGPPTRAASGNGTPMNRVTGANGAPGANGSTSTPLDLLRRANGANGNGHQGRNGSIGEHSSAEENGAAPANGASTSKTMTAPPPPLSSPSDDDPLLGFEHFPEAVAEPEVRWG